MNTYGWDTVFIVNEDRLNNLLVVNANQVTLDFNAALPGIEGASAVGKFSSWQIAQGGSNEIIHLRLPIEHGVLSIEGREYELAGITLVIATYLDWLSIGSEKEQLQFDYNKLGEPGNEPNRGELTVITLYDPNQKLTPRDNALLSMALGNYLVEHVDHVRFAFATVNLVAPATDSWLAPKKNAYGYFHREGLETGYLAIFSVTTDRDISNLQKTVDPTAIPTETNAAYIISNELFLENVIAPGLGKSFNTNASAFAFDPSRGTLRNTRRLMANGVTVGAITYYPEVDSLEVRSGENNIETYCKGQADMKAGIMLYYTVSSKNASQYNQADGALSFAKDLSPNETHNADIPWWFFLAGPIVIAITEIVVAVISGDLATEISNENRERLAFGKHLPSTILVGDVSTISVENIGVNNALYINGNV